MVITIQRQDTGLDRPLARAGTTVLREMVFFLSFAKMLLTALTILLKLVQECGVQKLWFCSTKIGVPKYHGFFQLDIH